MKRYLNRILACAIALFILLTTTAFAQEVRFTGRTNVRSGPGLDCHILGDMSKGSSLEYTGSTEYDNRGVAWYSVSYKGRDGWVSSKYAKLNGGSGNGGGGSGAESHGSGGSSGGRKGGYSVYYNYNLVYSACALRDVTVRSGPGVEYSSLGTLYKGEGAVFQDEGWVDERGVEWYFIRWCAMDCWVSSKYTIID